MNPQRILIASHNAGKVREIGAMLFPFGFEAISAASMQLPEPEETGSTFHANAMLKARAAADASGMNALADDSGLVIPALDGAPGIYSARWTGPDKNYGTAFKRIQSELAARGIHEYAQDAYFTCVLCLAMPHAGEHCFEGRVEGVLTFPPRGAQGFGYDPIFIPNGESRTFSEMLPAEKDLMSHRARAFTKLIAFLQGDA